MTEEVVEIGRRGKVVQNKLGDEERKIKKLLEGRKNGEKLTMRRLDKMISKKKESKSNTISCPISFFCSASLDNRLFTSLFYVSLPPSLPQAPP